MNLDYFRDKLFDVLNDSKDFPITDITVNEKQKNMVVTLNDNTMFEITCTYKKDSIP